MNLPLFYYRQHGANLTRDEQRIFLTRTDIKKAHFEKRGRILGGVAVIPVRGQLSDPGRLGMEALGDCTVLDWVVGAALASELLSNVLVVSSDEEIQAHVGIAYDDPRVGFVQRPESLERQNIPVSDTLNEISGQLIQDVVVVLSLANPFINPKYISDSVRSFSLYEVDTVVGVRAECSPIYTHDGNGLKSLLDQERFTRLERDALYRYAGGLSAFKTGTNYSPLSFNRRGHVLVDKISAHSLESQLDLNIARILHKELNIPCHYSSVAPGLSRRD